ncbi:unnamed protein product [Macrosiphum euphorbiae]|uniref:DNA-directed DNA polymerase n=1 Tax=Macrosiphum euphorbiae TaxID=13131 RepID=A0AAV0XT77_9HEMI|nr:unnamed protein product [Macrosiphum euphorbiae]
MLLMFENGIHGGLVQASKRYAKANNSKTPGYDETKDKSWIVYQDCNNLYGWAMSQYMPYGGFNTYMKLAPPLSPTDSEQIVNNCKSIVNNCKFILRICKSPEKLEIKKQNEGGQVHVAPHFALLTPDQL